VRTFLFMIYIAFASFVRKHDHALYVSMLCEMRRLFLVCTSCRCMMGHTRQGGRNCSCVCHAIARMHDFHDAQRVSAGGLPRRTTFRHPVLCVSDVHAEVHGFRMCVSSTRESCHYARATALCFCAWTSMRMCGVFACAGTLYRKATAMGGR